MSRPNKRFPLTAILALIVAAASLLFIFGVIPTQTLSAERFYVKEFPYKASAACRKNSDGCVVVVNKIALGWRGSQLDAALSKVGGWFGLVKDVPVPLKPQAELLLLSTDRNSQGIKVERRELSDPDFTGQFVADGDTLFYVLNYAQEDEDYDGDFDDDTVTDTIDDSQAVTAKGWRWDGQNFSPIPAEQAKQLAERGVKERRERARLQRGSLAERKGDAATKQIAEGNGAGVQAWEVYDVYPSQMDRPSFGDHAIKLVGADWHLRLQREGDPLKPLEGTASLKLVRGAGSPSATSSREGEQILARYGDAWAQMDAARYASVENRQMPASAASYFGRHFVPAGLVQLSFFFVFLTIPYWSLRLALSRAVSAMNFYPDARPENFPALDRAALARYTRELEEQGFVHVRDYAVMPASNKHVLPSFGRLFVHNSLNCFAEVGQIFTVRKSRQFSGVRCSIFSHFSDGRTFATTDREPQSTAYALRRPQNLWSARPGASVRQLIEWHIEVRREMEAVLGVSVITEMTAERFFTHVTESIENQRAVLRKRARFLLPFLVEDARLKSKKRYDWLGCYGIAAVPTGWALPQREVTSGEAARPRSNANSLLVNWVAVVGFASSVALNLSIYFWLFQPSYQRGALLFRAGLLLFGLFGFVLAQIAKRQQA